MAVVTRIRSEQLLYLAVGVPENNRQKWAVEARAVLEKRGFAVMEMTPTDIMQQADYLRTVYERMADVSPDDA